MGGDPTRRPLWPSEDLQGSAVHGGTVSYPDLVPKCALAPGPWVEVEQRKERFCQEGGETGGIQAWLGAIPDLHLLCSTVFLAKPWSRAKCDPELAELVVGPGHSADV